MCDVTACASEGWSVWFDVSRVEDEDYDEWTAGDNVHGAVEIGNGLVE